MAFGYGGKGVGYGGYCQLAEFASEFCGFDYYVEGCDCGAPSDCYLFSAVFDGSGCGIVPGGGSFVDGGRDVFIGIIW